MNNNILETIKKYDMLETGDSVLAAVSGGADSMLLLHFLLSVQDVYSLKILVAHVEHGIRGKESLEDALFVRDFCAANSLPYYEKQIDVKNEAAIAGMGVEEYARNARYSFFETIPCDKIATAHTLSDNVETILFRLARGTSVKGMCGIPPVRGKIVRPLIEITSEAVRDYCNNKDIAYRIDTTNLDNIYSRNYIRNEIIPAFENLNPSFEQTVARFINNAVIDEDYLQELADIAFSESVKEGKLSLDKLRSFSVSQIRRVLIKFAEKHGIIPSTLHVEMLFTLLHEKGKAQLNNKYYAVSDGSFLRFETKEEYADETDLKYIINVVTISKFLNIHELSNQVIDFYCDYDKISGNLNFRKRQSGDCISPTKRNCSKSLKKLFNEEKVPLWVRNKNIVVTDGSGVIGVVGCCSDERVSLTNSTENVCIVTVQTEDFE